MNIFIGDADRAGEIELSDKLLVSEVKGIEKNLHGEYNRATLPDILAPMINFSVNDHNKQILGKLNIIPQLLRIISLTPPDVTDLPVIAVSLLLSRRLASKISYTKLHSWL